MPSGARRAELARIDGLEASVDLLAFWRENRIAVARLIVTKPQVNLEVGADGRQNWVLGDGAPKPTEPGQSAEAKPIPGFVLGECADRGRRRHLRRPRDATRTAVSRRSTSRSRRPAADQPVTIDGGLTMAGKRATLAGSVARPQAVAAGETSPLVLISRPRAARSSMTAR